MTIVTMATAQKAEEVDLMLYTNNIRKQLVETIIGAGIPDSTEHREVLLKTLDGIDKNVVSKARLKIEESNSKNQAAAAELIGNVLLDISRRKNKAVNENPRTGVTIDYNIDDIKPGETEVNPLEISYKDIMGDE